MLINLPHNQRGSPEWVMRAVREGTLSLGVDFKGRQKVDEKTGKLRG
jgi:hypothetical protein